MLALSSLVEYCMDLPAVTQDFPFGPDTLVFRIQGKIFCLVNTLRWHQGKESITVKSDPIEAVALRSSYSSVVPGYHMNKKHWNTLAIYEEELDSVFIYKCIKDSYTLVSSFVS